MKTPKEIADEQMKAFTILYDEDVEECSAEYIHEQIIDAIESDRAQRREGVILSAHDGWRVWCATPSEIYEQIRDLEADGYDITDLTWEPA